MKYIHFSFRYLSSINSIYTIKKENLIRENKPRVNRWTSVQI